MPNKDKLETETCIFLHDKQASPSLFISKILILRETEIKPRGLWLAPRTHDMLYSQYSVKQKIIINSLPSSSSRQRLYTATGLFILCPCLFDCLGGAFGGEEDRHVGSGNVASGEVRKICRQSISNISCWPWTETCVLLWQTDVKHLIWISFKIGYGQKPTPSNLKSKSENFIFNRFQIKMSH